MSSDTVHLQTSDGPMGAYVARPAGSPRGGVVVVQEAFGVTDHIQDVTRRAAAAGYVALSPSLFHRSGSPVLDYDNIEAVRPHMAALSRSGLTADLDACFGWLHEAGVPAASTAIVGFCMGGSVATFAASAYTIGAAVSFYGGGLREGRFGLPPLLDLAADLRTPWLGLYGGEDAGIPLPDVEQMRQLAAGAAVDTDVVVYPGAQHGFHCDDRPAVFDAQAARAGWARAIEFIAAHVS